MDIYSNTVLLDKFPDINTKFEHASSHINGHPTVANDTMSRGKRDIFLAIYSFLFIPPEDKMLNN